MRNAHGLDPIQNGDLDDWDAMIDINVKGLLYVSKAIIPQMIENQVILSTSVPLLQRSLSNGNVYCATKHAVDALNQGMRMDLNPFGIRVGAIHPEWCRLNLVKCALRRYG
jgi:NADP-dependent 3-hydroxy acid dehydrogenase YdfG